MSVRLTVTEEWIATFTAGIEALERELKDTPYVPTLALVELEGLRSMRDDLIAQRDELLAKREAANAEATAGYAALRSDLDAWAEVQAERKATGA